MKISAGMTLISLMMVPLAASLGAGVELEVTEPKPGAVIRGQRVRVVASVKGELDTLYVVRIEGFNVTHNLVADPASARRSSNGVQTVDIYHADLPHVPGEHQLRIRLYRRGDSDALATHIVTVKVEQPSPGELQEKLQFRTDRIIGGSISVLQSRRILLHYSSEAESRRSQTPDAVREYHRSRNAEFLGRVDAYGQVAEEYLNACMIGRAETAVRLAEEVYRQDSSKVTSSASLTPLPLVFGSAYMSYAPTHLRIAAELCIREGKMDKARQWMLSEITWYEHQRDNNAALSSNAKSNCDNSIAGVYRRLARSCYLIDQDIEGYQSWMKKADLTQKPVGGGLLGQ